MTKQGDLGPEYSNSNVAVARQRYQLGQLNEAEFESHFKALGATPEEGMVAPAVAALLVRSNKLEQVSFEDQFTVIEFWSTTCGPCQYSMSKFNEFASEISEKHPGKVQCIAICFDEDASVVQKHIESRKWTNVMHFVDRSIEESRKSSPSYPFKIAREYVVPAIPLCVVVDQKGKIVYRGHSVEEGIDTLLRRVSSD